MRLEKIVRKLFLPCVFFVCFFVLSFTVFAESSPVEQYANSVSVKFSVNDVSYNLTEDGSSYDFNATISGYSDFQWDIVFAPFISDESDITFSYAYSISILDWSSFSHFYFDVIVNYRDGSTYKLGSDIPVTFHQFGTTWTVTHTVTGFVPNLREVSSFTVVEDLNNLQNCDIIISASLNDFYITYTRNRLPTDDVFNDFSGFGDSVGSVDDSEQEVMDAISDYESTTSGFFSNFADTMTGLRTPLYIAGSLIGDLFGSVGFINLLLRFSLSLGAIVFLLGSGVYIVSRISSGVRSAHAQADRSKAAAERSSYYASHRRR